ncbi:glycoside hydrolase family 3 N-terminal domain-containing protein [Lachnoclostridium sp. MSJ-17]|uniref:glycoside hydrolase family 3 N-terminal domain-containing protein n=1 Tax=Lachnoclostridium sp. MSJ-17 TaxID=2841516 RepID=UPI001C10B07B|nr:glycoside hydrolase family 3 N-terminal domain-containing protein [Lachnoclostridium sp. MSJ-17]MBU5462795.1 beta-hexosaminidase [Lachnoclostridium sp. MSJ-17]
MKKLIAIFLAAAALSLTACQSAGNPQNRQTTDPQTTEVTEPAEPETDMLEEMVAKMTVEEKVGQMFFARCPDADAAETAAKYHLGGYILFGRDFEGLTADEVRVNIQSYQEASDIPMLIGTDEEGGTVVRASLYLRDEPFLSPRDYYADGGWEAVEGAENEKADLLLSLGINVNIAPVCDVTGDPDLFMYERSFSGDADEVSQFVDKTVGIYRSKKLGSVLKHFPGYGDNSDTHTGIVTDSRSYSEFLSKDFKPFAMGISAGADCILVSHNIVECMDPEYPASLSDKVHQIIRNDLRYNGVVMTDDLIMGAISDYTGIDAAAVFAAKAGNDLLCCSDLEVQYPAVLTAVENQEIPMEQIDRSVIRVLKWKQDLGLIK